MCEFVPGEVLLSFPAEPPELEMALRTWFKVEGDQEHARLMDTMDERLHRLGIPDGALLRTGRRLWRVGVPEGQELFKVSWLRQRLQEFAWNGPTPVRLLDALFDIDVSVNLVLSPASAGDTGRVSARLPLNEGLHSRYQDLAGLHPLVEDARGVRVAVIDTGCSEDLGIAVVERFAFVDDSDANPAEDPTGHGSVVASIIADSAPGCELVICRVATKSSREITEWNVLAALRSIADVHVVNMSLVFGFDERECTKCGRGSTTMRSRVFEGDLQILMDQPQRPIVVAAAGNDGDAKLLYPAKYPQVVAVGSHTTHRVPSSFTNFGARATFDEPHENLFFFGGGESRGPMKEHLVDYPARRTLGTAGTSYACGYASAVVARLIGRNGGSPDGVLSAMRSAAVPLNVPDSPSASSRFGNGAGRLHRQ